VTASAIQNIANYPVTTVFDNLPLLPAVKVFIDRAYALHLITKRQPACSTDTNARLKSPFLSGKAFRQRYCEFINQRQHVFRN
jgi:hypothetical protein